MDTPLPIVLLPGLDGTGDLFVPFVAAAPPLFAPTAIALPGSGSYGELLDAIRDRLPPGRFAVLGESFSGPLALRVTSDAKDRVAAVVLCNTFFVPPATPLLRFLPWALLFAFPPPRWAIRAFLVGSRAPEELVDAVRAAIARTPPRVLAARMRSVLGVTTTSVDAPILFLSGTRDRLVRANPPTHVTHRRIDAPHLLLQTNPREAWDAIESFVRNVGAHP